MNVAMIKFFMNLKRNKPTLELNHQYLIECQGIMAVAELKTIDFVVYTQKIYNYRL